MKYIFTYLLLVSSLISIQALGNIAAPPEPKSGNILGQSSFQSISVLSEELIIDLSGVTTGENARIRACYKIYANETIRNLELVFIANGLTESKFLVEVDDNFVNGYLKEFDTIPQGWNPPDSIQFSNYNIPFNYHHKGLISFTIDSITAGYHYLEVSYEANIAEWYVESDISITRSFVYILKPENGWNNFKNLSLRLYIPKGWKYTSNLEPNGRYPHILSGFWEELPNHHLSIAFKPNENKARVLHLLFIFLIVTISFFLLVKWMTIVIKFRIKRNKNRLIQILNRVLISFISTIMFYAIYIIEPEVKNYLLDGQLNPFYTYGKVYFLLAWPIILGIAYFPTWGIDYILTERIKNKLGTTKPKLHYSRTNCISG